MEAHKNIHLLFENNKWKVKEEGSNRVLAEMNSKDEALTFAENIADIHNVSCIVFDDIEAAQEGMDHFNAYPARDHIET